MKTDKQNLVLNSTNLVKKSQFVPFHQKLKWIIEENESTVIFCPEIDQFPNKFMLAKTLDDSFHTLRRILKFGIVEPRNIKTKHVKALVFFWYDDGESIRNIDRKLDAIKILCLWLNKPGMVKSADFYLAERDR